MKNTMYHIIFSLCFIVSSVLPAHAEMVGNSYRISTVVIAGGGTPMSSASYQTNTTLGQPSPLMDLYNPPYSSSYELYPGFWYTIAAEEVIDADGDGIPYDMDNCPEIPNGPDLGTCTSGTIGNACTSDYACGSAGYCSMDQEDTDADGIGDVCDEPDVCGCDVSGDSTITPQDSLCAFQKYLGICPTVCGPCEELCSDVNGDGAFTPADSLCIFQEYLGMGCEHCN